MRSEMPLFIIDDGTMCGYINATEKRDELGLHAIARTLDAKPHDIRNGGYDEHMRKLLSGEGWDEIKLKTMLAAYDWSPMISHEGAQLLLRHGIRPAAACAMVLLIDGPMHLKLEGTTILSVNAPEEMEDQCCNVEIHLMGDISWHSSYGLRLHPGAPEAVKRGSTGRRLEDVITHPMLEDFDLMIGEAGEDADNVWKEDHFWLETLSDRPALLVDELISLRL